MSRLAIVLILTLAGCGSGPLSLLAGGGPNVAANVQAGAENNQAVAQVDTSSKVEAGRDVVQVQQEKQVEAQTVETVEIINETPIPPWVLILLILGWLLPTPQSIATAIGEWINRLVWGER